jgi:hypothetical protein
MRRLIMLSAVLVIAACSDNQQPTAPVGAGSASRDAVSAAELNQGALTNGKPQPSPVGFTKVAQYGGSWVTGLAGQITGADAECPAGWTSIGGGYQLASLAGTHPLVSQSTRLEAGSTTGWAVEVANDQSGAMSFQVLVYAICAS